LNSCGFRRSVGGFATYVKNESMGWRVFIMAMSLLGLAACSDTTVPAAPGGGPGGSGGAGAGVGAGGTGASVGVGGAGGTAAMAGSGGMAGSGAMAGSGGMTGGAGSGGTGGTGAMLGAGGAGGGVDPTGACGSEQDQAVYAGLLPGAVRQTSASAAIGVCEDDSDFSGCVSGEVQRIRGLSEGCSDCYGELEVCSSPECADACAVDPCACLLDPACLAIDYFITCQPDFFACAGSVQDCRL
jgi:hypothetical protein